MLMLLGMHVTSFLFLAWFNNFALHAYGLLLELQALTNDTHSYLLLSVAIALITKQT